MKLRAHGGGSGAQSSGVVNELNTWMAMSDASLATPENAASLARGDSGHMGAVVARRPGHGSPEPDAVLDDAPPGQTLFERLVVLE